MKKNEQINNKEDIYTKKNEKKKFDKPLEKKQTN